MDDSTRDSRPVLVIGATGTMGGATVAALLERGTAVRALVRRFSTTLDTRVEQVVGDLGDERAVRSALRGTRSALYISPHEDGETEFAERFARVSRDEHVRIVFCGVHVSRRRLSGRLSALAFAVMMPAYRAKLALSARLERDLPDAVMFSPGNFMDNDEWFLDELLTGTFPHPHRRCSRIAASDIGEACAIALDDPDFPAGTYDLTGSESFTGAECAAVWQQQLGRPVVYTGADAAEWDRVASLRLPDTRKGHDSRRSFALLGKVSVGVDAAALAATTRILGREPLRYEEYVRRTLLHMRATEAGAVTPAS